MHVSRDVACRAYLVDTPARHTELSIIPAGAYSAIRSSDALKNSPHSVTTLGPAAAAGRAAFLAIAMPTSSCSPVVTGTFAKGTAEIACAGYGLRL
jgi:hypothetical protein